MDTEQNIPLKGLKKKKIWAPDLNDEETETFTLHVELTRQIQEMHQLFLIFEFSRINMTNSYEFSVSGKATRKASLPEDIDDMIAINALTINYISSGRTLTEAIENSIKDCFGETSEQYKKFKDERLCECYDKHHCYRFLNMLRNFSQHGHLPVSVVNGVCGFDVQQILDTPHFAFKRDIKKELNHFEEVISRETENVPMIGFTLTLAEYCKCVLSVYLAYITTIEMLLTESCEKVTDILKSRPSLIQKKGLLKGFVVYRIEDGRAHTFHAANDARKMMKEYKDEAERVFTIESDEYERLKSAVRLIRLN